MGDHPGVKVGHVGDGIEESTGAEYVGVLGEKGGAEMKTERLVRRRKSRVGRKRTR